MLNLMALAKHLPSIFFATRNTVGSLGLPESGTNQKSTLAYQVFAQHADRMIQSYHLSTT
jgi:hypothetical protein